MSDMEGNRWFAYNIDSDDGVTPDEELPSQENERREAHRRKIDPDYDDRIAEMEATLKMSPEEHKAYIELRYGREAARAVFDSSPESDSGQVASDNPDDETVSL